MTRMAGAGTLDLSHLEPRYFSLDEANEALTAAASERDGGFASVIVTPNE
ncbi:MAG: hypothetical protein ACRDP6_15330 [Actinoallomurus sp.]